MKYTITIFSIVLSVACVASSHAIWEHVTFNYEGRIRVHGEMLTGQGYFKLAIVNDQGSITYWSNDGTSVAGDEPTAAIITDVSDGFFNIVVGDTEIPTMEAIDPTVFNVSDRVRLRTWFSSTGTGFKRLSPDKLITSPALLGIQTLAQLDLYVDPETGDDSNTGLKSDSPKKTVQAAWDAIPTLVRNQITIHLADGVYRQPILLRGKTVTGDNYIKLEGDSANPSSVLLSGSNVESGSPSVRPNGIVLQAQEKVRLEGLAFSRFARGIYANESEGIQVNNCKIFENGQGMQIKATEISVNGCEIVDTTPVYPYNVGATYGIVFENMARAVVSNTTFARQNTGIIVSKNSYCQMTNGCVFEDHERAGVVATKLSTANFTMVGAKHTVKNSPDGIYADLNAILLYPQSHCTFENIVDDVVLEQGAQSWGP